MQIIQTQTPTEVLYRILALDYKESAEPIWYCIAASAYASANAGPQVTEVYKAAIANTTTAQERGLKYFQNIYRDDMDKLFAPMHKYAPDIKQLSVLLEYGPYLSETSILNPIETSQITIAALLPLDVPTQVKWHMRGLIRNQGNIEMVKYALDIAKMICDGEGVRLRDRVPDISVIREDSLF
ncbi:hypothetical protein N7490_003222 [Penicillium lividum]|nr:hypothetical protein N7490_003222 [Penicillium lividum]